MSSDTSGVLIAPKWPLASFWPTLLPDGVHFINLVVNWLEFYPKYFSGESMIFRGVKKWATFRFFSPPTSKNVLED